MLFANKETLNPVFIQVLDPFEEAAVYAGISRFLKGATIKPSVDVGLGVRFKTVNYMNSRIKFKKGG